MAYSTADRKQLLAGSSGSSARDRERMRQYMQRTGLEARDFARRIGYSRAALNFFLADRYQAVASSDLGIRKAAHDFIQAHPIEPTREAPGTLYRTENYRLLRRYFQEALDHGRAYYVEGDPGTQKSFIAQHLVAELNRAEISKNGAGRRAYYVYCGAELTPIRLLKRVAEACGSLVVSDPERILRNLRFDFRGRRAVLVLDESQHLKVPCLEAIREVYDRPPHFGLLFLGSHAFGELFARNALQLEQWNSRFRAGKMLPGMSREEGEQAIRGELGAKAPQAVVEKLLKGATVPHLRSGGKQSYVSARRLFEALADLQEGLAVQADAPAAQKERA